MEIIKAVYFDGENEYEGAAYGYSSFSVRKNGKEIFHSGFYKKMPKDEDECLEQIKEVIKFISFLNQTRKGV